MKRKNRNELILSAALAAAFVIWTVLVRTFDLSPIGPQGSSVGFATLNGFIHSLVGVNMTLYTITDWLGLVPIAVALGFAILGLVQLIKRKSLLAVDRDILVLGGFYLAVIAVYVLFEFVVINYRPVLIDGHLEASYPSSTTLLVTTVLPSAMMQLDSRVKNSVLRKGVDAAIIIFIAFMVIGRIISGVHWITDITGGLILSSALVTAYRALSRIETE